MSLFKDIKHFINRLVNRSDYFIKINTTNKQNDSRPLTIKHKFRINAKDITTNQLVINDIVKKIIKKDSSKRSYAGKKDKDIKAFHGRIYQYESYRTQDVKLVPTEDQHLGVYVDGNHLGDLPDKYYKDVLNSLQTSVMLSFSYVTGGPFKEVNKVTNRIFEGLEPFDLTLYVQFG